MCWLWIKHRQCVRARASLIAVGLCWCESAEELRGERHLLSGGIFGLIHSNASKCGTERERAGATSGRAGGAESSASGRLAATRSHTPFPQKQRGEGRGYWSSEEIQTGGGGRGGRAVQLFPAHDDVSDPAWTQACFWRKAGKMKETLTKDERIGKEVWKFRFVSKMFNEIKKSNNFFNEGSKVPKSTQQQTGSQGKTSTESK